MYAVRFLFTLAVVITYFGADAQKEECAKGKNFAYDLEDCNKFYTCVGPLSYHMTCSADLIFSLERKGCVFKHDEMAKDCLSKSAKLADMKAKMNAQVGGAVSDEGDNKVWGEEDMMDENVENGKEKKWEKKISKDEVTSNDKKEEIKKIKIEKKKSNDEKDAFRKEMNVDKTVKNDNGHDKHENVEEKKEVDVFVDVKTTSDVGLTEGVPAAVEIENTETTVTNDDGDDDNADNNIAPAENLVNDIGFAANNFVNPIAMDVHCTTGQDIVPHDTLCHRYYNCTKPHMMDMNRYLTPYEYECPYPQLFSVDTLSCQDFESVTCDDRMEYLEPCDYTENKCSGPNCKPCSIVHPSCVSQPDGLSYWPGREGSGFWVQCQGQRTISKGNCAENDPSMRNIFSRNLRKCVPYSDVIPEVCKWSEKRLPHPYECHLFFDCDAADKDAQEAQEADGSDVSSQPSSEYIKMCPYPLLYSVRAGKCLDPKFVKCGERREAKAPCEYMPAECVDPSFASCEGLPDGNNVFRTREGTPHYVVCENERTLEKGMCEMDDRGMYQQFSPGVGKCMIV